MEILLHIGAHRTGCATFKAFMRQNADVLRSAGFAFWGVEETRCGLFSGIDPKENGILPRKASPARARGRVQLRLEHARRAGLQAVLVSEENLIGSLRGCIQKGALYPDIGERMSRHIEAFGSNVTRMVLMIRGQDRFWTSAIADAVGQGMPLPGADERALIAESRRSWRDVVQDLACAAPGVEIHVMPFEATYADPAALAEQALGLDVTLRGRHEWLNAAPDLPRLRTLLADRGQDASGLPEGDGMWEPFDRHQTAMMRECFADDMCWLAAGADGLAQLAGENMPRGRGQARLAGALRGQTNDKKERLGKTG